MGFLARIFGQRDAGDVHEWSTNFDAKDVGPFLRRIAPHIPTGFGEAEIQRVEELVASTPHDETKGIEFPIEFRGQSVVMSISVFMDDIESPDIYFAVPKALCELLHGEIAKFAEERGI